MNFAPTKYNFEYELLAWLPGVYECATVIYAGINIGTLTKFSHVKTGYFYIVTIFGEGREFKFSQKKYIKEFINQKIQIQEWALMQEHKRRVHVFTPMSEFTIKG